MPQRFLRPGITTSEAWNAASWFEQSFYIRLITLVDDAGRYDGRVDVLHSYCFPLRHDVKRQQTAAARSRLTELGLAEVYTVDGKEVIQLTKWTERPRNASKYPDRQESAADGRNRVPPSPSPSPSPSPIKHRHCLNDIAPSAPALPFLDQLKMIQAYRGIDIDREISKMQAWLLTPRGKGRKLTKGFVVNWLNKIDVPLASRTLAGDHPKTKRVEIPTEFLNWHAENGEGSAVAAWKSDRERQAFFKSKNQ